ncbi:MAG: methyltransferase [bacterium]|nr:methyltransferase [bacterium]
MFKISKMPYKNIITNFLKKFHLFITLLLSISGYVVKHATIPRTIAILSSLTFSIYIVNYQPHNYKLAIFYFILVEVFYIGFITLVLKENGFRHWFIKKWGDEHEGYLAYEATLGFIFFHNALSIGYIASTTSGNLLNFFHKELLLVILAILFIFGFIIKIWAAKVVSIDIYYWKDMFLGKKITDFVETGPYKYFNNPMYGIGQIQAYAIAVWYGSKHGLIAALLNQTLIFLFFYFIEKKFIERVYQNNITESVSAD